MTNILIVFCCLLLSACVTPSDQRPIDPIRKIDDISRITDYKSTPFIGEPSPENYSICHNNGCAEFSFINLSGGQWAQIKSIFLPLAANAQHEREQIKSAIALLEFYSGEQSNTYRDQAENSLTAGNEGQLDCIDEATNTTVYLRMLANDGLLNFHQQASRTSRGGFIIPHNTATILETATKQRYAVDSWFGANAEPPHIVPLSNWRDGWKPEND